MDELEKTAQETAAEEQTGDTTAPDAGEDFETLIRGRYKEQFDARVQKILDGRLRGLRRENERLWQEAVRTELLRQREQDEQLRRAMEFAVERARQQMTQAIASGGSRVAENGGRRRSVSRWDPKGLSGKELAEIAKSAKAEVLAASERAKSGPEPRVEDLADDMFDPTYKEIEWKMFVKQ